MGSNLVNQIKRRLKNLLIALDQFLWVVLTLGHASPDETISAGSYRMKVQGKTRGKILVFLIDGLFYPLEKDHCFKAYLSEINKLQLPDFYKEIKKTTGIDYGYINKN